MTTYVDQSGQRISLGSLIGKGGEGSVYRVTTTPNNVAKIYNAPLSLERQEKLRAITQVATPEIRSVCAWPIGPLLEGKSIKGFTMPFMPNRHELHVLHGPKSRKAKFPDATYGFLIHVAMNVARAFAVLHAQNILVGDVNDRGVMVGFDGTVGLIDCDSFQFTASSKVFLCDVGTPGFTPPELQGQHLRGFRRTVDHDNFGLAVIIFLILFMGRHPFAGRYEKGQIEPEVAIKEYRYAYSRQPARTLMVPPPNTIALDRAVNQSVEALFQRAFAPPTAAQSHRPTALEWAEALSSLSSTLAVCQFNKAHEYLRSLKVCPWCELEQRSGIDLFNFIDAGTQIGADVDLEPIWQAIRSLAIPSVPVPISEQSLGRLQGAPLPAALAEKIELLKARSAEGARARQVAAMCAADATQKLTEAQELKIALTDQHPDVARLTIAIARSERPILRSPVLVTTWFVAMIYSVAAIVFAPEYAIVGIVFLIVVQLSLIIYSPIRRRKLAALKDALNVARDHALAAEPFKHREVLEIEKAGREAEDSAKTAAAVADAIEADAQKLSEQIAAAKSEIKSGLRRELSSLEAKLTAELSNLDQVRLRARDLKNEYDRRTQFLRNGLSEWRQLKARRDAELKKLRDRDRETKLEQFMDSHFIAQADIPGITPALKAALASFGIETAADVSEKHVLDVQGFGPKRTSKMLAWRRRVGSKFTYVADQAIDPQRIRAIDMRFATERRRFERDFQVALTDLNEKLGTLTAQIQPAVRSVNETVRATARIRADIRALTTP